MTARTRCQRLRGVSAPAAWRENEMGRKSFRKPFTSSGIICATENRASSLSPKNAEISRPSKYHDRVIGMSATVIFSA